MPDQIGHTILLGGLGGDSHSVGLTVLRQALNCNGYRVLYLGTQNSAAEFVRFAHLANVVMVSNMDGHAERYLRGFPDLVREYSAHRPLWYLGGNLTIGDASGCEREFIDMGFDRVFVKFVDVSAVLNHLKRDLHSVTPVPNNSTLWAASRRTASALSGPVSEERIAEDIFHRTRAEVLQHWKTGPAAHDLEANAEFLADQPSYAVEQALVNHGQRPMLVQPRSGVADVDQQIKLFMAFKGIGIRALSYQVDSLTRNNNYRGAEEAIRESRLVGSSTINGFPLVNHGVAGLRKVISAVGVPLQARHSTRDPRLMAEIAYAGGVTAFEGGCICYNIPYYRDYPLSESIRRWQYVDRLTGLYYDRFGIVLDREFFGTLTAALIPPSLAIVSNLVEAVLAVQQGVKGVSLGYAEQGHRVQDIAAIRTMGSLTADVLANLGYRDIQISTVFYQYMAAFPQDVQRAEALIYNSAITAKHSGATRVITKTPVEAYKVPTMVDNLQGLSLTLRGIADAGQFAIDEASVAVESAIIEREVRAIFDSLLMVGGGSIGEGVVKGFQKGFMDIPFAPSVFSRGEVLTARDLDGAVRFLSVGQLQFDRELREFHEDRMQERRRAEGLRSSKQDYKIVEQDVLQIARGLYEEWPLGSPIGKVGDGYEVASAVAGSPR